MKHTKEEIEKYRQEAVKALAEYGKKYPEIDVATEIDAMKGYDDETIEDFMDYNTPQQCAWMMVM